MSNDLAVSINNVTLNIRVAILLNTDRGYVYVKAEEFENYDIRPKPLLDVLSTDQAFLHVVNRE